jgi:protein tyrosine/serine phosphatase
MKIITESLPVKEKFMIHVMGISDFVNTMRQNNLNDYNIEDSKDLAIISIVCENSRFIPFKHGTNDEHHFKQNHANVLNMEFYDIDREEVFEGRKYLPFSSDQAKRLIDFIEINQNKNYIIHCHAGISRSGAVGQFITDFYGWADKATFRFQYGKKIVPNAEVTRRLKEEWIRKYSKLDIAEYEDMLRKNEVETVTPK